MVNWISAGRIDINKLLPALGHRLRNLVLPVSFLSDAITDGVHLDNDLTKSLSLSSAGLNRLCSLLSVLSGKKLLDFEVGAGIDIRSDFPFDNFTEYSFVFHELTLNAKEAGASTILFSLKEGYIYCSDDGKLIDDLSFLGDVALTGRSGCGLGLAAVSSLLLAKGSQLEGCVSSSTKFRFAILDSSNS